MIGAHSVAFTADPHEDTVWGPVFNNNPEFATGMASWTGNPGTWAWASGQISGTTPSGGVTWCQLSSSPNMAKPPTTAAIRVTAQYTLKNANTYRVRLQVGYAKGTAGYETLRETVVSSPGQGPHNIELITDPATVPPFNYLFVAIRFEANTAAPSDQWAQSVAVEYLRLQSATAEQLGTDISCFVDEVSIHYGRDDTNSQPEAASCTLDMSTDTSDEDWPAMLEVGGVVTVTTTLPTADVVRFRGRVTDMATGWESAGPDTPERSIMQLIAAGTLADLGTRVVGDAPWNQELDGSRVSRVMAAAGITLNPATSDPGTVQILARDVDSQPALDVAQSVAVDAGGIVWATRAGEVRYADADHRRNAAAALTLDSCDILVTPTWRRTTEGLVNGVSIGYGPMPDEGEQPRYIASDPDSIALHGTYEYSVGTQLAAAADAAAMGQLLLIRNSEPVWLLGALPVDVGGLSDDDTAALLSLEMSDLILVTGMPAAGNVPTSAYLWVEGWSETLAYGRHDIELVVSGYCRTAPPPRWDDIDPATTWDSAPGTWDDATCYGPQPNLGRWNDVPATTRWNQLAPTVTWDTWPTPT